MEEVVLLTLTVAIELLVVLLLVRGEPYRKLVLATLAVNLITHPLVWQLTLRGLNWWSLEILVCLVEAGLFAYVFQNRRLGAAMTAVTMNVVTAAIGYLFF